MLKKPYNYFYWRCYDLLSLTGNYDLAWGASHFMSVITGMTILKLFFQYTLYKQWSLAQVKIAAVLLFLLLELLNYLLFVRHERYIKVISEFQNEQKKVKTTSRVAMLILLALGFYSLF